MGCMGLVQAKVSAPTWAGRALRRSLLKGCVVVIVVAGYSGKRFVYERAHELGIRCRQHFQLLQSPWLVTVCMSKRTSLASGADCSYRFLQCICRAHCSHWQSGPTFAPLCTVHMAGWIAVCASRYCTVHTNNWYVLI